MCTLLKYSRSTYYDKKHTKSPSKLQQENKQLQEDILEIYKASDCVYGAPKIYLELKKQDKYKRLSLKRVQRHMQKLGIKSETVKKYRPYAKKKVYGLGENLLNRDFGTTSINEKWVCDITYINVLSEGWCYLASVMDLHTKKIVGYSFSKNMTTDLVLQALDNAIVTQKPKGNQLIIHSDRGSQYTSIDYRNKITALGFNISYSAKGCPYDNACIESFHAILKKELVYRYTFSTFEDAKFALFKYIEGFYNRKRIHSAIKYKTPQELEDLCRTA